MPLPTTITTTLSAPSSPLAPDDSTLPRSGNATKKVSSKVKKTLEQQLASAREQIATEKAGKRKLFHSLVKLANELRKTRTESAPLHERQKYVERTWYDGGMWRAPSVLPGIYEPAAPDDANNNFDLTPPRPVLQHRTARIREAISLSDLFFNLVIVTAFTRVGVTFSQQGRMDWSSFLYFSVFWSVWNKQEGYSTRFDTTDLSAQVTNLVTCFAVLFASLSTASPLPSADANRIMYMAAAVSILYCALHLRVLISNRRGTSPLSMHVKTYAIVNIVATFLEAAVWLAGSLWKPIDWEYRWVVFVVGLLLGLRIPRAFLANDFHGTLVCVK
jgi:hypothetical protein